VRSGASSLKLQSRLLSLKSSSRQAAQNDSTLCAQTWSFVDRAPWYINESTPTGFTFLSLFIKSQCLYMFQTLLAHLQEALHSCYLV
jgi:hypothetical protein